MSHPSRVRGLKLTCRLSPPSTPVAPFTGAWIEIYEKDGTKHYYSESHPSRVRGLKLLHRLSGMQ